MSPPVTKTALIEMTVTDHPLRRMMSAIASIVSMYVITNTSERMDRPVRAGAYLSPKARRIEDVRARPR